MLRKGRNMKINFQFLFTKNDCSTLYAYIIHSVLCYKLKKSSRNVKRSPKHSTRRKIPTKLPEVETVHFCAEFKPIYVTKDCEVGLRFVYCCQELSFGKAKRKYTHITGLVYHITKNCNVLLGTCRALEHIYSTEIIILFGCLYKAHQLGFLYAIYVSQLYTR